MMGDKISRQGQTVKTAGIPVVPGSDGGVWTSGRGEAVAAAAADRLSRC